MKKLLVLPFVALFAAGCASSPLGLGVGTGISTGRVFAAGQKAVLEADRAAAPDCKDRKVTNTEVVSAPTVTATPYDQAYTHSLPDSSKGTSSTAMPLRRSETTYSEYTERWTVSRCGERAQYLVTFRPNGDVQVVADK